MFPKRIIILISLLFVPFCFGAYIFDNAHIGSISDCRGECVSQENPFSWHIFNSAVSYVGIYSASPASVYIGNIALALNVYVNLTPKNYSQYSTSVSQPFNIINFTDESYFNQYGYFLVNNSAAVNFSTFSIQSTDNSGSVYFKVNSGSDWVLVHQCIDICSWSVARSETIQGISSYVDENNTINFLIQSGEVPGNWYFNLTHSFFSNSTALYNTNLTVAGTVFNISAGNFSSSYFINLTDIFNTQIGQPYVNFSLTSNGSGYVSASSFYGLYIDSAGNTVSNGGYVLVRDPFIPMLSHSIRDFFKGTGSFSSVLFAYNPTIYAEISEHWNLLVKTDNFKYFFKELGTLTFLFLKYILREPAALIPT